MQNNFHNSTKNIKGLIVFTPSSYSYNSDIPATKDQYYSFKIEEKIIPKQYVFSIFGFNFGLVPEIKFFNLLYCNKTTKIDFNQFEEFLYTGDDPVETQFVWQKIASWHYTSNFNECLKAALSKHVSGDKLQYWLEKLTKQS